MCTWSPSITRAGVGSLSTEERKQSGRGVVGSKEKLPGVQGLSPGLRKVILCGILTGKILICLIGDRAKKSPFPKS